MRERDRDRETDREVTIPDILGDPRAVSWVGWNGTAKVIKKIWPKTKKKTVN